MEKLIKRENLGRYKNNIKMDFKLIGWERCTTSISDIGFIFILQHMVPLLGKDSVNSTHNAAVHE
jgi:hypothetical protein